MSSDLDEKLFLLYARVQRIQNVFKTWIHEVNKKTKRSIVNTVAYTKSHNTKIVFIYICSCLEIVFQKLNELRYRELKKNKTHSGRKRF